MVEDLTNDNNSQTWRSIHTHLVNHITARPQFLPSGRLKSGEKIDYRQAIENASKSMIRFRDPEHLIKMIVRVITEQVGVSHAGVLLHRAAKKSYVLIDSKGQAGKKMPVGFIRIPEENALINVFSEKKSIFLDSHGVLSYDHLYAMLRDKELMKKGADLKSRIIQVRKEMEFLGASICISAYFKKRLLGILVLGPKSSGKKFDQDELGFFVTLANDAAMAITNAQLIESLQGKVHEIEDLYEREHRLFIHTSIALAAAIDARDPYTAGHTERVTHYSLCIADELVNLSESDHFIKGKKNFKENLQIAALLHDIGKIGIPDSVLNKKQKLTDEEHKAIMLHSEIGAAILQPIRELGDIIEAVRFHQERYDGSGYPKGLKGEAIPILARIIGVADAFDAITTNRPYRKKRTKNEALSEIEKYSGTQFDPNVVKAFQKAFEKGTIL